VHPKKEKPCCAASAVCLGKLEAPQAAAFPANASQANEQSWKGQGAL